MTMRAALERQGAATENELGQSAPGAWAALTTVPCWLYSVAEREVLDTRKTAVVEDLRLMVPRATDVSERDRINGVLDRRGNAIRAGLLVIESVVRRRDHLELGVRGGVA